MTHQTTTRIPQRTTAGAFRGPLRCGETWCTREPGLYQADDGDLTRDEVRRARGLCQGCPIFAACLSDALVGPDVSGVVAGTTRRERKRLRNALQLTQRTVDIGAFAQHELSRGAKVDYSRLEAVLAANPDGDLATIAKQSGCSISTVKRYRRKSRQSPSGAPVEEPSSAPDQKTLLAAYRQLVTGQPAGQQQDRLFFASNRENAVKNPETAAHRSGSRRTPLSREPSTGQGSLDVVDDAS